MEYPNSVPGRKCGRMSRLIVRQRHRGARPYGGAEANQIEGMARIEGPRGHRRMGSTGFDEVTFHTSNTQVAFVVDMQPSGAAARYQIKVDLRTTPSVPVRGTFRVVPCPF